MQWKRLCDVCKEYFKNKGHTFVPSAGGALCSAAIPLMEHLLTVRKRTGVALSPQLRVQMEGGSVVEYLAQQALLRMIDSTGEAHAAIILQDPVPLTSGKTVWAIMGAGLKCTPTLRQMGVIEMVIHHYAFDRA